MYKILGADQKEYGPVGADEIRQWIAQGRANAQTRVQVEGSPQWRPLNTFPEFAAALAPVQTIPASFPASPMGSGSTHKTNGMAIAGFVLGLLSLFCCFIGPPFSILGLIFSCVGLAQINKQSAQGGKGLAIAGIILAIFGLLLFGFLLLAGLMGSEMQDDS
jgi:Domain of unknown function (DUF4190)/GYF domain 2